MQKTFLILLVSALSLNANAAIEFSTTEQERSLEGVKFKVLYFKDNDKTILYQPPRGWSVIGTGATIKLAPPSLSQAQGEIEQSPLPKPQLFDPETIQALQQKALASVPAGSTKAAMVSDEKSPLAVNGHDTYAVTVSYQAFGEEFMMSVLYLNLPDTQVRFRAVARKQDFGQVHGAIRASVISWQWARPNAAEASLAAASKEKGL
jgi:hypothetical protein